ncbi:MAG: hypothetical protein DRP11_02970 [Candidatus Aenigmatarchaeota archaeon]|nr:MAG: hypothetical protein DRP11_02970 [Candidatus Aenigmarchaeota archaeon]
MDPWNTAVNTDQKIFENFFLREQLLRYPPEPRLEFSKKILDVMDESRLSSLDIMTAFNYIEKFQVKPVVRETFVDIHQSFTNYAHTYPEMEECREWLETAPHERIIYQTIPIQYVDEIGRYWTSVLYSLTCGLLAGVFTSSPDEVRLVLEENPSRIYRSEKERIRKKYKEYLEGLKDHIYL